MELERVKLTLTREDLEKGEYTPVKEKLEGSVKLPVDDLMLGILHRMITEQRE